MAKRPIAFFDLSEVDSTADESQREAISELIVRKMDEELDAAHGTPEHRPTVWRVRRHNQE